MTIVGAFRVKKTPVLIGDMALMRGEIRSLRKKAYLISPNFVVAWSGYMIVAKTVISELKAKFGRRAPTRKEIEELLTRFDESDFGRLHTNFIGWIIDHTGQHCFLWNCLYPKEVFYNDCYFEGTGEQYFDSMRREKESWQSGGTGLPSEDQPILHAINAVAKARFDESLYQKTWDLTFGASYDILVFLRGRFQYIGSVIYLGWDYHWDSSRGTGRIQSAPVVIKHNCMGEFSILQEALQGPYFTGSVTNYLSRSVCDDMPGADLSRFQFRVDPQTDYFANYFIFRGEDGRTVFKSLVAVRQPSGDGPLRIQQVASGAYFFDFDTQVLDQMYANHGPAGT